MLLNILLKTSLSLRTRISKYLIFLFVFSISAVLLIPGCGDDTVSSDYNIEMPRFNWRKINLYQNDFDQVWAIDTGNIYLLNISSSNLYKLSEGNLTNYYIGNNYIHLLSGIGNQIIIYALSDLNELKFIFWNGSATEVSTGFFLPDTLGNFFTGCATENMGYWISSQSGVVSYNNGNLNFYYLDDPFFTPERIFKSSHNTIRMTGNSFERKIMYEFQDTSFVKIFDYSGNYLLRVLNNEAIGYHIDEYMTGPCFYTISGNTFIESFCTSTNFPISFGSYFSGSSLSDLFIPVYSNAVFNEPRSNGILHWNGNKFSREFAFDFPVPGIGFGVYSNFIIDENTSLILEGYYPKISLYIGTRKK